MGMVQDQVSFCSVVLGVSMSQKLTPWRLTTTSMRENPRVLGLIGSSQGSFHLTSGLGTVLTISAGSKTFHALVEGLRFLMPVEEAEITSNWGDSAGRLGLTPVYLSSLPGWP